MIDIGGIIFTYAGFEPKIPVPIKQIERIQTTCTFHFETAKTKVPTPVENLILINHDYNHQNGTHGDSFKIVAVENFSFESNPDDENHTRACFEAVIEKSTLFEKIQFPARFFTGKFIKAQLDNYFPSLVIFQPKQLQNQEIFQIHIHYPISENESFTSIIFYSNFTNPFLKLIAPYAMKSSGNVVIVEDVAVFDGGSYDIKHKDFRLPHEKGAEYVWERFENWK